MILRSLNQQGLPKPDIHAEARPAYEVFVEHQKQVRAPYLPIPQSSHAHLAGELAAELLPEVFTPLPAEVIEAIQQHDYGWIGSDLAQVHNTRNGGEIRSFPELSAEEAVPAWESTVRLAETASPLIGVLVNRHFCLLSDDENPLHQQFRKEAGERRKPVEASLGIATDILDRWTTALGICDLLSLYLCSGCCDTVELPFCHPADKEARKRVRAMTLCWENGQVRLLPPLFRPGTQVKQTIPALRKNDQATGLEWKFL